jgi:hypothetical protein
LPIAQQKALKLNKSNKPRIRIKAFKIITKSSAITETTTKKLKSFID